MGKSLIYKVVGVLFSLIVVLYIIFGYFLIQPDIFLINDVKKTHENYKVVLQEKIRNIEDRHHEENSHYVAFVLSKIIAHHGFNNKKQLLKELDTVIQNTYFIKVPFLEVFDFDNKLITELRNSKYPDFSKELKYDYTLVKKVIVDSGKVLGTLYVYVDNTDTKSRIRDFIARDKEFIESFNSRMDYLFKEAMSQKIVLTVIFLIFVLGFLAGFLNRLINKPISKIKDTLEKFTRFLKLEEKDIEYLDINTKDEFQSISEEINKTMKTTELMFNQINDLNLNLEGLVEERTVQILQLNRQISDSIKVALAIQNSVLPDTSNFNHVFEDSFIYWKPKDIVSGDIYLARQLGEHDCFVMVADCTGHGVSGAFITMLIKAIEKDLILLREQGHLDMNNDLDVLSPSKMLQVFNRKLKELLNQHYQSEDIKLDFGFDGGVLYMNHKTKLGIYAGARMPLYICQSGKIKTLKPDKFSIGYSKSDINHEFNEYLIDFSTAQTIYMVTDGVLDQLGGPKGYPFGKKKFLNILEQNQDKSLAEQKSIIKKELTKYQQDFEQTDDRTIFALKI